jgi:glycosyltransferase involved in cell wall biosynthesis
MHKKLNISFNGRLLLHPRDNGTACYAHSLFEHLSLIDSYNRYHVITGKERSWIIPFLAPLFLARHYAKETKRLHCDVAFIPWLTPFYTPKTVVTVHDLLPLCYVDQETDQYHHTLRARLGCQVFVKKYAPRAGAIIVDSEATKRDLLRVSRVDPDKIRVIPLGLDPIFHPRSLEDSLPILNKYGITQPYFINTSSLWQPRKNLVRLLEAFRLSAQLHPEIQLVITGKRGPSLPEMLSTMKKHALEKRVLLLETVSRNDLPFLLSGSAGMIFPSLYEGFGLPPLEAMGCGCPLAAAVPSGAVHEVTAHAAISMDPLSITSIHHAMERLLCDNTIPYRQKGAERASLFSWDQCARKTLDVLEEIALQD